MSIRETQTTTLNHVATDSVDVALAALPSSAIVTVTEAVWVAVRTQEANKQTREGHKGAREAHESFIHEGRFLLLRGETDKAVVWCDTPQPYALAKRAWISHSLLAGYMNEAKLYCLLQVRDDDQVVPAPQCMLKPHALGWLNQRLQQQAWETPTWECDRCSRPFPPPSPVTTDTAG